MVSLGGVLRDRCFVVWQRLCSGACLPGPYTRTVPCPCTVWVSHRVAVVLLLALMRVVVVVSNGQIGSAWETRRAVR